MIDFSPPPRYNDVPRRLCRGKIRRKAAGRDKMAGVGTLINVAGIIIGGLGGLLFGKKINESLSETLTRAVGVCVLFLGISGGMEVMLTVKDGVLSSVGAMVVIVSVAGGGLLGELLNIEAGMERFGGWLKRAARVRGDEGFVDAFVTASLTVCVGAMAVVGAIEDGTRGDYSTLMAKAVLDAIIVLIMAATLGKGCIFSAIPVFFFQGGITLLAGLIAPALTDAALANISLTGSILIFCVGINLVWGKRIRVANLLPAILIAAAFAFLPV